MHTNKVIYLRKGKNNPVIIPIGLRVDKPKKMPSKMLLFSKNQAVKLLLRKIHILR
jgi:hypothetical protein